MSLSKERRLGSSRWRRWRWLGSLDLCGRIGFDLEGVQARCELLCEGGVDESVALHCRLRCGDAIWFRASERHAGRWARRGQRFKMSSEIVWYRTATRHTLPANSSETISTAKSVVKAPVRTQGLASDILEATWDESREPRTGFAVATADLAHGLMMPVLPRVVAYLERGGVKYLGQLYRMGRHSSFG